MPQMPPARPVCSCLRRRARRRDGSFENKRDFAIAVEGDEAMFNQFGVILVSPEQAIAGYKLNDEQLFSPNAQGQS